MLTVPNTFPWKGAALMVGPPTCTGLTYLLSIISSTISLYRGCLEVKNASLVKYITHIYCSLCVPVNSNHHQFEQGCFYLLGLMVCVYLHRILLRT